MTISKEIIKKSIDDFFSNNISTSLSENVVLILRTIISLEEEDKIDDIYFNLYDIMANYTNPNYLNEDYNAYDEEESCITYRDIKDIVYRTLENMDEVDIINYIKLLIYEFVQKEDELFDVIYQIYLDYHSKVNYYKYPTGKNI